MELSLYHPQQGYFLGERLRSVQSGDFLTSPEVSPLFGETLAESVRREVAECAVSRPIAVDVGAGSGSLLKSLVAALAGQVEPWAVEVSPPAQRAVGEVVGARRVVSDLGGLPERIRGVIFANELLDNLPMALARRRGEEWREMWVGAGNGKLMWVEVPARPEVEDWVDRFSGPTADGGMVEVQIRACEWARDALARLECGALVVIDYGDTAHGLEDRRADGTLRTYRAHHLGPPPLAEPGQTDITADVNFTAVMEAAREAGASVSLQRQDEFLEELGLRERIEELRREEMQLARSGDEWRRMQVRSLRTGGETLLHPRGLGGFQVLTARKC
ncbi:MAG: SAM-dependent methyltransferase [bacterium]|nr:SAM-dependent methyltransferase [Acidimicrobiia bacterium]MCY4651347.1 SAM-dependent methyltransferase [bacterium]